MSIAEFGQRSFVTHTTGLKERIKEAEKEIQMREIKFRAWDTKRKKMWSADEMGKDQLTLMPDGRGFVNVDGTSTKLSHFCPHLIPMQFTGLKDKNGKDVFEGDKITFVPVDGFGTKIRQTVKVYYCTERLAFCVKSKAWDIRIKHNCLDIELIEDKKEDG